MCVTDLKSLSFTFWNRAECMMRAFSINLGIAWKPLWATEKLLVLVPPPSLHPTSAAYYFSSPSKWGHAGQLRIALGQKLNWGGESERKKNRISWWGWWTKFWIFFPGLHLISQTWRFLPFFHGCRNTSLIKVFSLLIEDNRLMRSACRSYKKQQLQNVLVFFEKKLYIQAPSL